MGFPEPAAEAAEPLLPLRRDGERCRALVEIAADFCWETDAALRFTALAGAQPHAGWPRALDALEPAAAAAAFAAAAAEGRVLRDVEVCAHDAAGRLRWYALSGRPRRDAAGAFCGYDGVGRDVTALRHAAHQIERREREFDAFARHLAHELRTPIAHVEGLAQLIDSHGAARLDADERQWLGLQVRAAQRMRETVDALLELSRAAEAPMPLEAVDVSAIARDVIAEMATLGLGIAVAWHVDDGLRAQAAPAALRIVLANLLGNAAKFTRHAARPAVRVEGRHDADGRLRVAVQDNGAGFDAAMASRLFTPFSRLHGHDEFHGSGIGLSIVRRIVERHGGSVRAHGERGRGARFEFTLPAAG